MNRRSLVLVGLITLSSLWDPGASKAQDQRGADSGEEGRDAIFTVPRDATVYLSAVGGSAGAVTEVGLGTTQAEHVLVFKGLSGGSDPTREVSIGWYSQGSRIPISLRTIWQGKEYWAFWGTNDTASRAAFQDLDGSLDLGDGGVVECVGPDTWVLHLDDAASFLVDDSDDDVLIQVRLGRE